MLNCLRIASAINVDIEDLLPKTSSGAQSVDHLAGAFLHPKQISPIEMFDVIRSVAPWEKAYFCPDTLPEFCKTLDFVMSENGIGETEAMAYLNTVLQIDYLAVAGVMILKENVLRDLLDRRNSFAGVSSKSAYQMFENLRDYVKGCPPSTRIVVADPLRHRVDTILMLNDTVAITYPFGSYFVTTNKAMLDHIKTSFEKYSGDLPTFNAWYESLS